jgi:hypothetical protein
MKPCGECERRELQNWKPEWKGSEVWILLYERNARLNYCRGFDVSNWHNARRSYFPVIRKKEQKKSREENSILFQLVMIIAAS